MSSRQPAVPFQLSHESLLKNLKSSERGAVGGPSDMTANGRAMLNNCRKCRHSSENRPPTSQANTTKRANPCWTNLGYPCYLWRRATSVAPRAPLRTERGGNPARLRGRSDPRFHEDILGSPSTYLWGWATHKTFHRGGRRGKRTLHACSHLGCTRHSVLCGGDCCRVRRKLLRSLMT